MQLGNANQVVCFVTPKDKTSKEKTVNKTKRLKKEVCEKNCLDSCSHNKLVTMKCFAALKRSKTEGWLQF